MTGLRIINNDAGEVYVMLDGKTIRSWNYANGNNGGEGQVMRRAREFTEGWFQASQQAREERKALVAALEPFAAVAETEEEMTLGDDEYRSVYYYNITAKHFRAARAALNLTSEIP